jgi:ABC-2 type transport system ATP-binding protein
MCDDIALIHQSNKLIEGKLDDVKKQYRSNTFEVGIAPGNIEHFFADMSLNTPYVSQKANFKTLDDELKMQITLPKGSTSRELLNYLMQKGDVTYFVEKIPSVNDIFIQTVSKR